MHNSQVSNITVLVTLLMLMFHLLALMLHGSEKCRKITELLMKTHVFNRLFVDVLKHRKGLPIN